jgi:hypothetical protein
MHDAASNQPTNLASFIAAFLDDNNTNLVYGTHSSNFKQAPNPLAYCLRVCIHLVY